LNGVIEERAMSMNRSRVSLSLVAIMTLMLACAHARTDDKNGNDDGVWTAEDFGPAGSALTEAEVQVLRGNACTGTTLDPEEPCTCEIPTAPEGELLDLNYATLVLHQPTGAPIQILRESPPCLDGYYLEVTESRMRLCTDTCTLIRSDPDLELELMVGCADVGLPPPV
jgi:hypothetical protein